MEPEKAPTYEEILRHLLDGGEVKNMQHGAHVWIQQGQQKARRDSGLDERGFYGFVDPSCWRLVPKIVSKWQNVYPDKMDSYRLILGLFHETRETADRDRDAGCIGVLRVDRVDGKVVARVLEPV